MSASGKRTLRSVVLPVPLAPKRKKLFSLGRLMLLWNILRFYLAKKEYVLLCWISQFFRVLTANYEKQLSCRFKLYSAQAPLVAPARSGQEFEELTSEQGTLRQKSRHSAASQPAVTLSMNRTPPPAKPRTFFFPCYLSHYGR